MVFEVEYWERLSRWKTAFRLLLALPALIFANLFLVAFLVPAVSVFFLAGWIAVFLKRRYPRWLFVALSGYLAFTARLGAYGLLLTDRYPSFDIDNSPVTLEYDEPAPGSLSRWRVWLWKSILVIPHFIVLWFLWYAVQAVTVIAWFAILFTGRYPRGLFGFVTGVGRWFYRVIGYVASFNDRFPPFALSAEAGPGSTTSAVICGMGGGLATAAMAALVVLVASFDPATTTVQVDYAALERGSVHPQRGFGELGGDPLISVTLQGVADPGDDLAGLITAGRGERTVVFEWRLVNVSDRDVTITASRLRLKATISGFETNYSAELLAIDGRAAPERLAGFDEATVRAVFIIPVGAEPVELRFRAPLGPRGGIVYVFD